MTRESRGDIAWSMCILQYPVTSGHARNGHCPPRTPLTPREWDRRRIGEYAGSCSLCDWESGSGGAYLLLARQGVCHGVKTNGKTIRQRRPSRSSEQIMRCSLTSTMHMTRGRDGGSLTTHVNGVALDDLQRSPREQRDTSHECQQGPGGQPI